MRGGLHRRKAPTMETAFDSIASMQSSQMMEGVADVAEEMMTMQRPKRIRSAIVWSILVIVNNMIIICAAFFVVQRYMQVESDAFKPDLYVRGSLEPEALDVTTDQEEQTVRFVSRGEASAASVRAATSSSATLVLGKSGGSSDWQIDNDPMDKLVFSTTPKGQNVARSDLLVMDGVTKTSTLSTHAYDVLGALVAGHARGTACRCTQPSAGKGSHVICNATRVARHLASLLRAGRR